MDFPNFSHENHEIFPIHRATPMAMETSQYRRPKRTTWWQSWSVASRRHYARQGDATVAPRRSPKRGGGFCNNRKRRKFITLYQWLRWIIIYTCIHIYIYTYILYIYTLELSLALKYHFNWGFRWILDIKNSGFGGFHRRNWVIQLIWFNRNSDATK